MASGTVGLRHEARGLKHSGDSRVKLDGRVVNSSEPVVSLLAPTLNPSSEVVSDEGVDHVTDIPPRHLLDLSESR